MTIQQIQYFLMAAEKMSFTETAKAMYVSQPAVSRQISLLEEEIGLELFRRNKSTLQLTSAGERLAAFFSKTFQEYREIRNELKTDAHKLSGVVTLGSPDGWNMNDMVQYIQNQLANKYPNITFRLNCYNHNEFADVLKKQEADIIFHQKEVLDKIPNFSFYPVRKIQCALYYSAEHPVAQKNSHLTLNDFVDYPLYVTSAPNMTEVVDSVMHFFARFGVKPQLEYVNTLSAAFVKMLSENGVFLADSELIQRNNPLFSTLLLPFERTLCIGSWKNRSEICMIVQNLLMEYFENRFGFFEDK